GGGRWAAIARRVIAVAVVQQDDGTGLELAANPGADFLAPHARIRIPHTERPTEYRVREASRRRRDERIAVAVRGPEAPRVPTGGVGDQLVRAHELFADRGRSQEVQLPVSQRVISHIMALRGDAAGARRTTEHVLSHADK